MLQKVVEIDRTKFFVKFIEKHWIEFLFYFRRKTKSSTDWAILFRVSSEPLSSFLLFWKFFAYTVHACIESRIIYRNGNPIRCLFLLFYTWNFKKKHREWKEKFDLVDNDEEDTLTYHFKNTFKFRPDLSGPGLTGDEIITMPHPCTHSICFSTVLFCNHK